MKVDLNRPINKATHSKSSYCENISLLEIKVVSQTVDGLFNTFILFVKKFKNLFCYLDQFSTRQFKTTTMSINRPKKRKGMVIRVDNAARLTINGPAIAAVTSDHNRVELLLVTIASMVNGVRKQPKPKRVSASQNKRFLF